MKELMSTILPPLLMAIVGGVLTIYVDVQKLNEIARVRVAEAIANEKEFKHKLYELEKRVLLLENK